MIGDTTTAGGSSPNGGQAGGSSSLRAFRHLQRALQDGVYPAGARLPAERTLAAELRTSRTSVRQALQALTDSGLLSAMPNRGWFVADAQYREGPNALRSFTQSATDKGLTAGSTVISRLTRPATLEEADQLALAPASAMLEIVRLRRMGDVPICVTTSRLSLNRAGALADMDLTDRSLFQMLEEVCGIIASRCQYEVQAAPASAAIAAMLGIAPNSPVLIGSERIYDQDDRPVVLGLSTYRGDAYRFQATLFRN